MHFLQIECQTLQQQKYYYLHYCSARFIVVVWNQTHDVSELRLYCFYTWVFPELRFSLCTIYFSHSKEVFDKNASTPFYNLFTYWSITWKWYWSQYSGGFLLTDVNAHSVRIGDPLISPLSFSSPVCWSMFHLPPMGTHSITSTQESPIWTKGKLLLLLSQLLIAMWIGNIAWASFGELWNLI